MNRVYIILFIIVLLLCYLKKQETFVNQDDNIKKTLKNTWGGILDINTDLNIEEFKKSSKISVSNIIRTIPCKNSLFSHKLNINTKITNTNTYIDEINYDYQPTNHINNYPTGIQIGNDFEIGKNNSSYGFVVTFNPEQLKNNFAYIGIEMKSKNNLQNLDKMNKHLESENIPERKVIEIFTNMNSTSDLLSYFTKGEDKKNIEYIGIFEEQNNIDFIKSFTNNKFNLLDLYGNKIITGCKIDYPYCNIELPIKGNVRGRNGYLVGKYSPKNKGIMILNHNNDILKYENPEECNTNINEHKKMFEDTNNTQQLALDDNYIKQDSEFINKYLIDKTDFKCREHNSEFNKKIYYGGIDEDEKMKCHGADMECNYYENDKKCQEDIAKVTPALVNLNPLLEQNPVFIPKEYHDRYKNYNGVNCIKTREKEVVCKHIHNKVLSDIITFNVDECIEKNARDIIDSREVIEIRHPEGFGELKPEQEKEYYKNKYFIEPYIEPHKNYNPLLSFQNIRYFLKLKNFYDKNIKENSTVCEIIEVKKEGKHNSLGYILEKGNIYKLKSNDKIYININKDMKMKFSIISNDIIAGQKRIDIKLEGKFGSPINYYLATNNTNMFKEPKYTQNVSNYIIPYASNIKINVINK